MRVLRVLALAIVLAIVLALACFAQYLFDYGSLAQLIPNWLLDRVPYLAQIGRWLDEDLHTLGLWLFGLTALGFGLLAPPWVDAAAGDAPPRPSPAARQPAAPRIGLWLAIGGAVAAGACGLLLWMGVEEPLWLRQIWAGALFLFVAGTNIAGRRAVAGPEPDDRTPAPNWSAWVLLLFGVTLLLAWGWTALPVQIDAAAARVGVFAASGHADGQLALFTPGATGAPGFAYLPMAAVLDVTGDALAAAQMVGLAAGLATVLATWLVGTELFRHVEPGTRRVRGVGMAFVAAALVGANIAMLHFARMAPYLPATAAGVFGCWALARGMRTGNRAAFGAGGLLAGLALLLDRNGMLFPLVGLAWWGGYWLLAQPQARQPGVRRRAFLWWLGGLATATAPVLGYWLRHPAAWQLYRQGALLYGDVPAPWPVVDLWANLRNSLFTFFWTPDAGPAFGYPGHLLDSITAPLFVLSIGGLLFNLDRPVGWRLLTWLGLGIALAALASATAPDWSTMLPLVPAAALAVSFALDRIRVLWMGPEADGDASGIAVLAGGLLVAAALMSWISYFPFAHNSGDAASFVGRSLRAIGPATPAVLVSTAATSPVDLNDPIIRFAANGRSLAAPWTTALPLEALPAAPAPGTVLLVLPADQSILPELRRRFPEGVLEVARDLAANPQIYLYRLP